MENNAWLLKDTNGDFFAVSEVEMVEYIPLANTFTVPVTPYYCNHIMAWREQLIPIFNLASLFELNNVNTNDMNRVGIFAYQLKENTELDYVAIPIQESPIHIVVNDSQFCDLPTRFSNDRIVLSLSCFSFQDEAVPVLNINYLVSTKFQNTQQQVQVGRQDSVENGLGNLES